MVPGGVKGTLSKIPPPQKKTNMTLKNPTICHVIFQGCIFFLPPKKTHPTTKKKTPQENPLAPTLLMASQGGHPGEGHLKKINSRGLVPKW